MYCNVKDERGMRVLDGHDMFDFAVGGLGNFVNGFDFGGGGSPHVCRDWLVPCQGSHP